MTIRQELSFQCSPETIYRALTSETEFGEVTGAPAEISADEGGAFSCFGGQITGRLIELVPDKRIVQAWRAGPWEEGVYSIVKFDIDETGTGSTLIMEHNAYPEGFAEHLEGGWHKMYWEPLKAFVEMSR